MDSIDYRWSGFRRIWSVDLVLPQGIMVCVYEARSDWPKAQQEMATSKKQGWTQWSSLQDQHGNRR